MDLLGRGGRGSSPRRPRVAALGVVLVVGALLACSRSEPAPPSVAEPVPSSPRCAERLRIHLVHPGASPADVEQMDVMPVEQAVGRLEAVEHVDSTVTDGRASVWVEVSSSAEQAREAVRGALEGLTAMLPEETEDPLLSIDRVPRSWLVVLARGPAELRTAAAEALEHTVLAIPGTYGVRRLGRSTAALSIEPDPTRLSALGLDAAMLAEAVERELPLITPTMRIEDLADVEIATWEGATIRLRDVATLRRERMHEGSRAWVGGSEGELWVVKTNDADAVRQAVDAAVAPPDVSFSVAGELVPRGCPSGASQRALGGDFELLEFALPSGSEPSLAAELLGRAPAAGDAVWWTMEPLLDDAAPPDPTRVQLLIPTGSPHRTELLRWVEQAAGLELHGHYGPDRAHVVLALRHPELERIRDGATWVVEAARARGWEATTETAWTPRLDVKVDRDSAARLEIRVAEALARVQAELWARNVGVIDEGGRPLPVRILPVGNDDALAQDPAARLGAIRVPTPSGTTVPLSALVRIEEATHPSRIERSDLGRVGYVRIWIEAEQEGSTEAAVDELIPAFRDAHPDVEARREP